MLSFFQKLNVDFYLWGLSYSKYRNIIFCINFFWLVKKFSFFQLHWENVNAF